MAVILPASIHPNRRGVYQIGEIFAIAAQWQLPILSVLLLHRTIVIACCVFENGLFLIFFNLLSKFLNVLVSPCFAFSFIEFNQSLMSPSSVPPFRCRDRLFSRCCWRWLQQLQHPARPTCPPDVCARWELSFYSCYDSLLILLSFALFYS